MSYIKTLSSKCKHKHTNTHTPVTVDSGTPISFGSEIQQCSLAPLSSLCHRPCYSYCNMSFPSWLTLIQGRGPFCQDAFSDIPIKRLPCTVSAPASPTISHLVTVLCIYYAKIPKRKVICDAHHCTPVLRTMPNDFH